MVEKRWFIMLVTILMAVDLSSCKGNRQKNTSPQTGTSSAPKVFYSTNKALRIEQTVSGNGERIFYLTSRNVFGEYAAGSQVSEFEFACAMGDRSTVKQLLQSADFMQKVGGLEAATGSDSPEIAKLILASMSRGEKTEFVSNPDMAPLHIAAMHNSADVAKLLIKEGVNVNMRGEGDNTTAIFWAALFDSRDVAKLLIKAGASVNAGTSNDETPLMVTTYKDSADMAELLIKAGANVNAKDSSGSTALMYAEMNGAGKVAAVLKKHGAKETGGK